MIQELYFHPCSVKNMLGLAGSCTYQCFLSEDVRLASLVSGRLRVLVGRIKQLNGRAPVTVSLVEACQGDLTAEKVFLKAVCPEDI